MADFENANPFTKSRRTILLRTILGWTVAVLLIGGGLYYITRSRQSNLLILGSTSDVTITLNGQTVQGKNDHRGILIPVFAGVYRLQITKPDNEQFSTDITIPSSQTLAVRPIYTLVSPTLTNTADNNSSQTIDYVVATPDQKTIYYLGDNRTELFRMEVASRTIIPLNSQPLRGVSAVEWSNDPSLALVVQTGGTFLQEIPSFDFTKQRLVKVAGPEIISPVWDPNNNTRIAAAYYPSTGEKSLVLTDKLFSSYDRKTDLTNFTDPKLIWSPDSHYIGVINRDSDSQKNDLWIYDLTTGSFKVLTSGGGVLNASFSPKSNAVLIETLDVNGNHIVKAKDVTTGTDFTVSVQGTVKQTAWRDSSSFYSTGTNTNTLTLNLLNGQQQTINYNGAQTDTIQGMFYFSDSQTLVFYTETSVYTVNLNGQ